METVTKCWEEMPNEVLARTYSLHRQIVNVMIVNNGKNDFNTKMVNYILNTGSNLLLTRMEEEYIVSRLITTLTGRKRRKDKTSATEYLDVLSGNVHIPTLTQLSNSGNGIVNQVGRSESNLGRSVRRAMIMMD